MVNQQLILQCVRDGAPDRLRFQVDSPTAACLVPVLPPKLTVGDSLAPPASRSAADTPRPSASGKPRKKPRRSTTVAASSIMTISRANIVTARAALESRVQAAADAIDSDDIADMEDLGDVVIATNVTLRDLDTVPDEWLEGLKLELRADGALVVVSGASEQSSYAAEQVYTQLDVYARGTQGVDAVLHRRLQVGDHALKYPDIQLRRVSADTAEFVSIAAFDIEAPGRSGPQMIEHASAILTTLPQVECVVCFKFYAPRAAYLALQQLRIPALAIVFRRGTTNREIAFRGRQLRLVRIEQMHSFGNSGIDQAALRVFTTRGQQRLLENPFGDLLHLTDAPVAFPDAFDVGDLDATLPRALLAAQAIAPVFAIGMSAPLPPIRIDLPRVFVAAVHGWAFDPRAGQRGIPDAAVDGAAPGPVGPDAAVDGAAPGPVGPDAAVDGAAPGPVGAHVQADDAAGVGRVVVHVRGWSWRVARWVAQQGVMPWVLEHVATVTAALQANEDGDNDAAAVAQ